MTAQDRYLLKHYGITTKDKERMYEEQEHKCSFCHNPIYELRRAVVDHDHRSGKVRALLHSSCNRDLGKWESGWLKGMVEKYLGVVG